MVSTLFMLPTLSADFLDECLVHTMTTIISLLQAESAIAALNCSGVVLGSLPIRLENTTQHNLVSRDFLFRCW